jgi:hypothetical protein
VGSGGDVAGVRSAPHDPDLGGPLIQLVALTLLALVVVLSGWMLVEFYRFMRETR